MNAAEARDALVRYGVTPAAPLNGKAPRYSASTIKQYKACPRKHYYEQVCGIEVRGTQATDTGTAVHKIVEEHLKQVPEHKRTITDPSLLKIARSGFPHLPDPTLRDQPQGTELLVEKSMSMATWINGPLFTGTPDLLMVRPDKHAHLYDHKTTSGYRKGAKNGWVLTDTTLPHDPQAITYSMFAFRLYDVAGVSAKWIYYDKKGLPATLVTGVMQREPTERKWRDLILPVLGDMHEQHTTREALRAGNVDRKGTTTNECNAYGGCPHRAYCRDSYNVSTSAARTVNKKDENDMSMSLADRLKAQAAGNTATPVAASAPPVATPPPAASMFNPPPVVKAPPLATALDVVAKATLGLSPFADSSVTLENSKPNVTFEELPVEDDVGGADAVVTDILAAQEVEAKAKRGRPKKTKEAAATTVLETTEQGDEIESPKSTPGHFNLFVGCAPVKGSAFPTVNIFDVLAPFIAQAEKINGKYWGCIEYAQGRQFVAAMLQEAYDAGKLNINGKNVVAPSVAIETEVARTVLYSRAAMVVERAM